jgi:hypothetical protein
MERHGRHASYWNVFFFWWGLVWHAYGYGKRVDSVHGYQCLRVG